MTIFNMTDLHGNIRYLDRVRGELESADVVVISGDITNFGGRSEAAKIIEAISSINSSVLAVSGNCDRSGVERYLDERGINLHGASRTLNGLLFAGLGGALPGPVPTPNTYDEGGLAGLLDGIDAGESSRMVFVSHQPPFDTVADRIHAGRHVGSRTVRGFIERCRPLVCLTGHIHESIGEGALAGSRVVNPGPFGDGYYATVVIDEGARPVVTLKRIDR